MDLLTKQISVISTEGLAQIDNLPNQPRQEVSFQLNSTAQKVGSTRCGNRWSFRRQQAHLAAQTRIASVSPDGVIHRAFIKIPQRQWTLLLADFGNNVFVVGDEWQEDQRYPD